MKRPFRGVITKGTIPDCFVIYFCVPCVYNVLGINEPNLNCRMTAGSNEPEENVEPAAKRRKVYYTPVLWSREPWSRHILPES